MCLPTRPYPSFPNDTVRLAELRAMGREEGVRMGETPMHGPLVSESLSFRARFRVKT